VSSDSCDFLDLLKTRLIKKEHALEKRI